MNHSQITQHNTRLPSQQLRQEIDRQFNTNIYQLSFDKLKNNILRRKITGKTVVLRVPKHNAKNKFSRQSLTRMLTFNKLESEVLSDALKYTCQNMTGQDFYKIQTLSQSLYFKHGTNHCLVVGTSPQSDIKLQTNIPFNQTICSIEITKDKQITLTALCNFTALDKQRYNEQIYNSDMSVFLNEVKLKAGQSITFSGNGVIQACGEYITITTFKM